MHEIDPEYSKVFITIFNFAILIALPGAFVWHLLKIKSFANLTTEWWLQVMTCILYIAAFDCEIPACWSRLRAYYVLHMQLDSTSYVLNTWDRWGHVVFYGLFIVFTVCNTRKHIPQFIKSSIS